MPSLDIAQERLHNQHIASAPFKAPAEVVHWFGAVQAQDYAGAKWALGLRLEGWTDTDIERALAEGTILRTHLMRPTWHFVTPEDIRWLFALTGPRVNANNAYMYRKQELDEETFLRSQKVLTKALQGGNQLTHPEMILVLQRAGINTNDIRFTCIMMRAELDGLVCNGVKQHKQHTYALLEERVPQTKPLEHAEALVKLATRYFFAHGPATLKDFIWWSGLTTTDAREALEMAKPQLNHEIIAKQTYWFAATLNPAPEFATTTYLLPNYDEYIIGYKDRKDILKEPLNDDLSRGYVVLNPNIIVGGRIVGNWKRTIKKNTVELTVSYFEPPNKADQIALARAVERYSRFLGSSVTIL